MARKGLGNRASSIFGYGDIDVMSERDSHHEMLDATEQMALRSARSSNTAYLEKLRTKLSAVQKHVSRRTERREGASTDLSDMTGQAEAWRSVGIRERFTLWRIPAFSKWLLWLLIAGIDFYIFAQAVAFAENIKEPGPGDSEFWMGGAYGLIIFLVGIFVARALRKVDYSNAQKKLLKDLGTSTADGQDLRVSQPSVGITIFVTVTYVALIVYAYMLRSDAMGEGDSQGLLLIQTIVPALGVVVELLIDDPTEVRLPQRNPIDWYLEFRERHLAKKLDLREKRVAENEGYVGDQYRFERAALDTLHDGVGTPARTPRATPPPSVTPSLSEEDPNGSSPEDNPSEG